MGMPNNLLLTGVSGVGKSTVLTEAAELLKPRAISGFLSPRTTGAGSQSGWLIEGFNGVSGLVADPSITSTLNMGAFGVDMELFNRCVDVEMASFVGSDLVMIDEIGIIGGWSQRFQAYVTRVLDDTIPVVAIIRSESGVFSDQIKLRNDVELWTVTEQNRSSLAGDIASWVNGVKAFDANKA